ncbi:MAG: Gfo/Idh/MocA family oxidoreductase [Planctomycetes bacterium]|nr:Gfo/Idh/MocA family oxidoreductase [Planctomycetota bacterium]
MIMKMNRRTFLKTTAAAAGTFAVPVIVPSSVFGKTAPGNRVNLGFIGVGNQGTNLLKGTAYNKQAQIVAVCDCFESRRQAAIEAVTKIYTENEHPAKASIQAYADVQELLARADIDGVFIATPDHWHVPIAIQAVQAGKDVYVEKPLGVSLDYAFKLRKLVGQKEAVLQYGTQQRSDGYFRFACELVRNGYIGKIKKMDVWCDSVGDHKYTKTIPPQQPVPAGFDYDRWLGPAPVKPYCDARVSNLGAYHIYDYALGFIAGWGAHPLDIAQWGNNTDDTAPIRYEGTGVIPTGGLFDTISSWDMNCTYADGVTMHFMDTRTATPVVSEYYPKMRDHGTTFHGTEGWVTVRRGAIDFSSETLRKVKLKDSEIHLYNSPDHYANFVDCVKSRKKPISPIEAAVQSDLISHLSNAAIRLKQPIEWDPKNEKLVKDEEIILAVLNRTARKPWGL